jgi:predicted enzyme involved in methoxymalonyl-ACP biosynthesis
MADLTDEERTRNARAAYVPTDRNAVLRARYSRLIENVLRGTKGKPSIDILLALSGVCPAVSKGDVEIWLDEVHRALGEAS